MRHPEADGSSGSSTPPPASEIRRRHTAVSRATGFSIGTDLTHRQIVRDCRHGIRTLHRRLGTRLPRRARRRRGAPTPHRRDAGGRGRRPHNWKYVWVTEHHFLTEYSHISANEVVMPHILARTQNIRVCSGIINVTPPVNHPARIAERVAMMDHLSAADASTSAPAGARRPPSRAGSASPTPTSPRRCSTRSCPSSARCGARTATRFDGRFFSMPERNVLPKPYVKPHPPMWVAAGNPDTFEKAGQARPRRPVLHRRLAREDGAAGRDSTRRRSRTPTRSASTSTTTSPSPPTSCASRTATPPATG